MNRVKDICEADRIRVNETEYNMLMLVDEVFNNEVADVFINHYLSLEPFDTGVEYAIRCPNCGSEDTIEVIYRTGCDAQLDEDGNLWGDFDNWTNYDRVNCYNCGHSDRDRDEFVEGREVAI